MVDFWDSHTDGKKDLLRLLTGNGKWLAWPDKEADPNDAGSKRVAGCREQVEDKLNEALHSTNVVVLLGSGASFCAKNADGSKAPGMWHLWHAVRDGYGHAAFDQIVKDVMGDVPAEGKENIEGLLSLCKMSIELLRVQSKNDQGFTQRPKLESLEKFIKAAEKTILEKVDFVKADTELVAHAGFIRKFGRRSPEKPRVKLFTTNYDLCIETAAARLGVVLVDGFSHAAVQRFNRDHFQHDIVRRSSKSTKADYLDGVFHSYKLHGSVDWRRQRDGAVIRSQAEATDEMRPVLIYPRSTKYQEAFETPYLDMFAALQEALREPDTTLIVSGFGFADDHISAPIWSAIETNLSLRVILCDTCFIPHRREDHEPELEIETEQQEIALDLARQRPHQKKLVRLVQQGDNRITVLNGRFEDLAHALPEISGKTDRQLLQDRLAKLGEPNP
jgi:hypothetical protein